MTVAVYLQLRFERVRPTLRARTHASYTELESEDRLVAGRAWRDHDLVFARPTGGSRDRGAVRRVFQRRRKDGLARVGDERVAGEQPENPAPPPGFEPGTS